MPRPRSRVALIAAATLALGLAAAAHGHAPARIAAQPAPAGIAGSWHLVLDDEFTGSSLSGTQLRPGWPPSPAITADVKPRTSSLCLDPSHAVVAHGELELRLTATPETCAGTHKPYTSALVSTNGTFTYRYGVLEARIWVPAAPNGSVADWPSFWATNSPWPQSGEDDILEGLASGSRGLACFHYHWGPSPAGEHTSGGCAAGSWSGAWHTFAADWEPGSITYYYDGRRVGRVKHGISSTPQYVVLGLGSGGNGGGPLVVPATERIDFVRVWQR